MKELVDRIEELMAGSELDKKSFAEKLNISAATLSHISSGRNNPSLDLVLSILQVFPDVSPDWLLFGRGAKTREEGRGRTLAIHAEEELNNRIKLLKMLKTEHYRTEMTLLDELRKKE